MRKYLIITMAIAASIGLAVPTAALGTTPKTPKAVTISAGRSLLTGAGGGVTIRATENGAKVCAWHSSPKVNGFDGNVKCAEAFNRVVKIPANKSDGSVRYTFTVLTANRSVKHSASAVVVEGGKGAEIPVTATAPAPAAASSPVVTVTGTGATGTSTGGSSGGSGGGSGDSTSPVIGLGVTLDPTFTQGNTPSTYLDATFAFSASATVNGVQAGPGQLPSGVLDFYNDGSLACSINVGASVTSGSCPVVYSTYGNHSVITEYLSGTNSATTGAQAESITPPPITVNDVWGTTAGTVVSSLTANVIGSTASVSLSDPDFEGATSVGITDNLSDQCTATVSGTTATCSLPVTGTPTTFSVAYGGGTSTVGTQAVSPNGVQSVTTTWPAETVPVNSPSVTVQSDHVNDNGGTVKNGSTPVNSWSGNAPDPIIASVGYNVRISADTTGTVNGDTFPIGYLTVTVSGPGGFTDVNETGFGSTDCTAIANFSSQALGTCQLTFSSSGTYYVTWTYTSQDSNYASGATLIDTVNIG